MALKRVLSIYKDLSLNNGRNAHLMLNSNTSLLDLITYLARSRYLLKSISADNYRVETGRVLVSYEANLKSYYKNATTIAEWIYEDETAVEPIDVNFYAIKSIEYGADKVIFFVEKDLWTSYIRKANFSKARVVRSNRKFGVGRFEDINAIVDKTLLSDLVYKPLDDTSRDGIQYVADSQIAIGFVANIVVSSNIAGDEYATAQYVFFNTLDKIRAAFSTSTQNSTSSVELAIRAVSGIFANPSSFWGLDFPVEVSKIFLIPQDFIDRTSTTQYVFKTKTQYDNYAEINLPFYIAQCYRSRRAMALPSALDLGLNFKYYAGVIDEGLPITRSTDQEIIYIVSDVNVDGLKVSVIQGDRQKDISHAFQVSAMGNAVAKDSIQEIATMSRYLQGIVKSASGIYSSGMKENYFGVASSATDLFTQIINAAANRPFDAQMATNSDGFITFNEPYNVSDHLCRYPFYLTGYKSLADEEEKAKETGAIFDVFDADLTAMEANAEVIAGIYKNYIQADVIVSNIPKDAGEFIKSEFARGIYITFI